MKTDDGDVIKVKLDLLNTAAQKLGSAMYGQGGPAAGASGQASPGPEAQPDRTKPDEDVIDAEYEVKDNK